MQSEFLRLIESVYSRRRKEVEARDPERDPGCVRDLAIIATVLDCLSQPMLVSRIANARQYDERMTAAKTPVSGKQ